MKPGLVLALLFLVISFFALPHYGLIFDSPKNLDEAKLNLSGLLNPHPLTELEQILVGFQIHGAFFFMISVLCRQVFSDTLGWTDPVSAYHLFLPFLVAGFVLYLYHFLRKHSNKATAILTCIFLLTFPRFFSASFNDIKDIALLIFFSMTIFLFYDWLAGGMKKIKYFYAGFVCLGLALLCKLNAVFAPLIVVLWWGAAFFGRRLPEECSPDKSEKFRFDSKLVGHLALGCLIVTVLLALFFMPAFYLIPDKAGFIGFKMGIMGRHVGQEVQTWTAFPLIQILFGSPVSTLLFAIGGIGAAFRSNKNAYDLLFLIWLAVSVIFPCTPFTSVYDGIRLFLFFLIPLNYFAATGVIHAAQKITGLTKLRKPLAIASLGFIVLMNGVAGIIQTHPYETAYFNLLAGGLGGAQKKGLPDAADYTLNSYRQAIEWINLNGARNANVLSLTIDGWVLSSYYSSREDLFFDYIQHREFLAVRNSYIIVPFRTGWPNMKIMPLEEILTKLSGLQKVYRIERQGGEILTIYYNP